MNLNLSRAECAKMLYDLFDGKCEKCGDCCRGGNGIGGSQPSCISQKGFFNDEAHFEEMKAKYGWTDENGFLGDDGCKIPVEERAITCLEWGCPKTMKKFTQDEVNLASLLKLRLRLLDGGTTHA